MTDRLVIALAQLNPTVGAVAANLAKAREAHAAAQKAGADLILFPELYIAGYPPEDLVLRASFVTACREAVEALARDTADGPAVLIGLPGAMARSSTMRWRCSARARSRRCVSSMTCLITASSTRSGSSMRGLPRDRSVSRACASRADLRGYLDGRILRDPGRDRRRDPARPQWSPFEQNKDDTRLNLVVARVTETGLPLAYLNQIGGQDELVFDGASFVLNADRALALQMPMFEEALAVTEWVAARKAGG